MPTKQAIDGRHSTSNKLKARSYSDGFADGIERCADRIALLADQLDGLEGDVGDALRKFSRWLHGGNVPDPLVLERRHNRVVVKLHR